MSRMLGFCLTLGTADTWSDFSFVASVRLEESERAALAYAALRSLDASNAEIVAAGVMGASGTPLPSFLGGMDEARSWAAFASPHDLKTHALAAFEAMTAKDQAAFFRHISALEVAA